MRTAVEKRIIPGMRVYFKGEPHHVKSIIGLDEVVLIKVDGQDIVCTKLSLVDIYEPLSNKHPEILNLTDDEWKLIQHRFQIIEPLVDVPKRSRQLVSDRAKETAVSTNTIYNWLKKYERSGLLTSLLPKRRSDAGKTAFSKEVEKIIGEVIEREFMDKRRKSVAKVCDEVRRECFNRGFKAPHRNTIRNRIKLLNNKQVMKARHSSQEAAHYYRTINGEFPHADAPLRVIQIDHTKLDIILVDDVHRINIGRPFITLACCVHSRVVFGVWVGFENPSALSVGLTISQGILAKDKYLEKVGVDGKWPIWGIPTCIHADNAKEFRGEMLKMACQQHNVRIEWRPVGKPQYGAHIERLLGTFSQEIHTLPGTTSSSVAKKGSYNAEKEASLTLGEFEEWLVNYIVNVYHQREHSSLGMSPLQKLAEGIHGNEQVPGVGTLAKIKSEHEEQFKLDFMPHVERTVQNYGIVWNKIYYYHDVLRPWNNAEDEKQNKHKKKFIIKYDPRDISSIYFYDPSLNEYFLIPYRDISKPMMSIWELREVKKHLKDQNHHEIDEALIFRTFERMKEIEEAAVSKTVKARRKQQTRKQTKSRSANKRKPETSESPIDELAFDTSELQPFDDIDEDF
ncbi:MAG: Mu transposase C-terminal domain-containing protein [Marinicella pacifica]